MPGSRIASPDISPKDITFVNNSEVILDPNEPVTGRNAEKVLQVGARNIWHDYGTIVLAANIDEDFRQYAADFGREPEVITPTGVNLEALSILDGGQDPAFRAAIGAGKLVESFVATPQIRRLVEDCGGCYFVDQPDDATTQANYKGRYAEFVEGLVEVPEGKLVKGIDSIVDAVADRLLMDGKAFVRHTLSGGGFGNRRFDLSRNPSLNPKSIRTIIEGEHPELWQEGEALVEKYLDLVHSPAVSFGPGGFTYDNLQITHNSEYWGSWSPVPPDVCAPEHLRAIGDRSAGILRRAVGFQGRANNDFGTTRTGNRLIGMEFNARDTAMRHAVAVGTLLLGTPWEKWRKAGHVIKTLDHFELQDEMSFSELHAKLGKAGLLASAKSPYGAVITIPPQGNIVGIQVQENGYKRTEGLYQEVLQLAGDTVSNRHDSPYIPIN